MAQSPDLARTIGPLGLAATVVNTIIGSSIFVFPAIVAAALGPAGLLGYVLAASAMALIVLCLADSGTRVTGAGGTYAYVEAAYGPFAAWLVGLLLYLGVQLVASAVVASVFVGSLSVLERYFGEESLNFVTPGDPESCARAILDIYRRPEAARAKAKRAREHLQAFRWELQVERYLGLLERLTGGPVAAPGRGRFEASEERP